jgi:phospholipase C
LSVNRTRREVLVAGMAGAFGLALAGCAESTIKKAASVKPASEDLGAVEHVVFLMHENRSFDHYYGTYPGVRGYGDPDALSGVFRQSWPGSGHASQLLPFHLDTLNSDAECTYDLSHEWNAQHLCWNQGRMDSFVSTHTEPRFEGPEQGVLTMGYYTREDLPFWYSLADAFTICDNYHCSVFGPTHPNRLHAWSGTLDPGGTAVGPILVTNSSPKFIGSLTWPTMPEELQAAGVSWKVYNAPGDIYQPSNSYSLAISDNILLYFRQHTSDPSSPLYRNAFGSVFPKDLAADVANGELPAVSWVTPPNGFDEHPPAPPAAGMWFANQVIDVLSSNPDVWSKTVLFITYDENDGFFDHVPPPTAPAGTPGEYLTVDPLPADAFGTAGPIGLGFRVPMLVVSPFSRGGYVCSDLLDHTSHLRFIETRFGVKAPNISDWRRSVCGDLSGTLSTTHRDATVPALPPTNAKSRLVDAECTSGQLFEIDVNNPTPYPVPAHQAMPVQEPGATHRI